jgi:hypothetical protein
MAKWQIPGPDGGQFIITAPDNMSEADVMKEVQARFAADKSPKEPSALDTAADVAMSTGVGVGQGALGLATLPANLEDLVRAGVNAGGRALGYKEPILDPNASTIPLPNYNEAKKYIEDYTGEFYEPKTTLGEYFRTGGEFLPGAVGGSGLVSRVARVAVPAIVSETAGQATKGTEYEPYARVAGAVAGGSLPQLAGGARRAVGGGVDISPTRAAQIAELENRGVTSLTAGQRTGNNTLRFLEDASNNIPLGGRVAGRMQNEAGEQFTRAALREAGVTNATRATGDVIEDAARNLGTEYSNLAPRMNVAPSQSFVNRIERVARAYADAIPSGEAVPLVGRIVRDFEENLRTGRNLTGDQVISYLSNVKRVARETRRPEARRALNQMADVIQAQAIRSVGSAADRRQLRAVLRDVNTRYRNLMTVEDAIGRAPKGAASEGIVTPTALKGAVKSRSRRDYTRDRTPMARLAKAGESVLTPLPSSGTAERQLAQSVIASPIALAALMGGQAAGSLATGAASVAAVPTMARGLMSRPVQQYLATPAPTLGRSLMQSAPTSALYPYLAVREDY